MLGGDELALPDPLANDMRWIDFAKFGLLGGPEVVKNLRPRLQASSLNNPSQLVAASRVIAAPFGVVADCLEQQQIVGETTIARSSRLLLPSVTVNRAAANQRRFQKQPGPRLGLTALFAASLHNVPIRLKWNCADSIRFKPLHDYVMTCVGQFPKGIVQFAVLEILGIVLEIA